MRIQPAYCLGECGKRVGSHFVIDFEDVDISTCAWIKNIQGDDVYGRVRYTPGAGIDLVNVEADPRGGVFEVG